MNQKVMIEKMEYIDELTSRYSSLLPCKESIEKAIRMMIDSYEKDGKLLIAGNGGSSSDSDHISGELLKTFKKSRSISSSLKKQLLEFDKNIGSYLSDKLQGSLPAIALSNNTALITASLNDVAGDLIFAQQVIGLGKRGDVFLGISTSGNSMDIVYAMIVARAMGLQTIALTGRDGGKLKSLSDVSIIVPDQETFKIQELHLPIYHAICLQLEDYFW